MVWGDCRAVHAARPRAAAPSGNRRPAALAIGGRGERPSGSRFHPVYRQAITVFGGLAAGKRPGPADAHRRVGRCPGARARCAGVRTLIEAELVGAMSRIRLPAVTLVCVDTRHPDLAVATLRRSLAVAEFGAVVLFTAAERLRADCSGIRVVGVSIDSIAAYSAFMLTGLVPHVRTTHALVVQWDGFPTRGDCWDDRFLDYDYIGAPWPDVAPGGAVGNGGFSLRSRRLLQALATPGMVLGHPEDLAICRDNRRQLETEFGIRFAPVDMAARFAYERCPPTGRSFGFHGLFNWDHEFPPTELAGMLDRLPDALAAGLDAHELTARLVARGDRGNAARLLAMRRRLGMWDRRTLKLWSKLWWAGYRRHAA